MAFALLLFGLPTRADLTRIQSIEVRAGWNAVYLEVDPLDSNPATLFSGLPIEIVATYWSRLTPVESVSNPADAPWKQEGWGVWYAPARPDAVATSLHAIQGRRAYLIQASRDVTWSVSGSVTVQPLRWQTDSYNLIGFSVDPQSPPTFESFFAGSPAHRGQRCFRLVDGLWTLVRDPSGTRLRAGEAYWVYCRGASRFQGPLDVRLQGFGGLDFGKFTDTLQLDLANHGSASARFRIESIAGEGTPLLPLSYEARDLSQLSTRHPELPAILELPPTASSDTATLRLRVLRAGMIRHSQESLLRISDGAGCVQWVPLKAIHPDLPTPLP